jgi:hypothetical protein
MSMSKRVFEAQQEQNDAGEYFAATLKAFEGDFMCEPAPGDEERTEFFNSARALLNVLQMVVQEAELRGRE